MIKLDNNKKLGLELKDLKASRFYMITYFNKEGYFHIGYVINVKKNSIREILLNEGITVINIQEITYHQYIKNNMAIDDIEVISYNLLKIEFWQSEILTNRKEDLFDKLFNLRFVDYYISIQDLKEIQEIKGIYDSDLLDYTTQRNTLMEMINLEDSKKED